MIYLKPLLIFWLSNKGLKMIIVLFTFIIKIINSSKNFVTSVDISEKDKMVDKDKFDRIIKFLAKFQKH